MSTPITPSMSEKKRMMIDGTKVLWSTIVYVPTVLFSIAVLSVVNQYYPLFPDSDPAPSPKPAAVFLWITFLVIVVPLALRSQVWRPLRQLARLCGDPRVFKAHCKAIAPNALRCVPLMAIPISILSLELGEWFMLFQIGVFIAADRLMDRWRDAHVDAAVEAILPWKPL